MFCSAVIPTIDRKSLTRTVQSVLNQQFREDDFEVIVVNDTGERLPETDWHRAPNVQLVTIQKRERSVARNTGAAMARGRFLYFLDDDDIMLPGAMQALWELSKRSDAQWLYGGYQTTDDLGSIIQTYRPDPGGNISALLIAGESIPLQSSFFRHDAFYLAGEFDAHFIAAQDRDFERRLSLIAEAASTPALIANIRIGQEQSSTVWSLCPLFDRLSREKAFEQAGAPTRLWASAGADSYLHGRVCRAYLASAFWNLKHGNVLRIMNRLLHLVVFSMPLCLSPQFWTGFRTSLARLGETRREEPTGSWLIAILLWLVVLGLFIWVAM